MIELLAAFSRLQKEVDFKTLGLVLQFVNRALESGDPQAFLREVLSAVVESESPDKVEVVEVKVLPIRKSS
jgi:hypothetical protein